MRKLTIKAKEIPDATKKEVQTRFNHMSNTQKLHVVNIILWDTFMAHLGNLVDNSEVVEARFEYGGKITDYYIFRKTKGCIEMSLNKPIDEMKAEGVENIETFLKQRDWLGRDEFFLHPLANINKLSDEWNLWDTACILINIMRNMAIDEDPTVAEMDLVDLLSKRGCDNWQIHDWIAEIKIDYLPSMLKVTNIIGLEEALGKKK